jgi:MscS family membrane protein
MTWRAHLLFRWLAIVLLSGALAAPVTAQVAAVESLKAGAATEQKEVTDPLGRSTPRGVIIGFLKAVNRDDFAAAARFLQLSDSQRKDAESLARDLTELMDRYFTEPITSISESPDGALDDGLPPDRERLGPLTIGGKKAYVMLVRVTDPQAGRIWLISTDTLSLVPLLQGLIAKTFIERVMPRPLLGHEIFGMSPAHWIVLAASLLIPFIVLWLLDIAVVALTKAVIRDPPRRHALDEWHKATRWPGIAVLALAVHLASTVYLGFPLAFRITYTQIGLFVWVVALAWLMRRILTIGFARARSIAWAKDRSSTQSLMVLGERLLKAAVVLVAVFVILTLAGVDTKTALTGLGIGGVALALGAQKTVENLLGGILLLSDRAIAVGDFCNISNRVGTIEDITLRSVRVRTLEQTLLSVPAGVLAQAGIENYVTRAKILILTTLRLRYGTSVEQLTRILGTVRKLIEENPKLESGARIRLVNFGSEAVELELFAFVLTADFAEFLEIRENLLLKIATIVEAEGSGFAQPTQFIYADGADGRARIPAARDSLTRQEGRWPQSMGDSSAANETRRPGR